jgi:hypothetical protein
MLILFDHGTPRGLAHALAGHTVITAEAAAIDLLLTTDQRIRYQQNLKGRKIAIVVLAGTTKWSRVRLHPERTAAVVIAAAPGSHTGVDIPFE